MTTRDPIEVARAAARAILADYPHLDTPERLRADGVLEDIAHAHRAIVVDGGLTGCAGRLLRAGDRAVIRARTGGVPGRRAFTIAHELGHLVLGHGSRLSMVCADTEPGPSRSIDERAAHAFAAELLMPEAMVASVCADRSVSLAVAGYLATRFRTSFIASARRLVETTVTPCAIAFSQDGIVTWARRSRTFSGYIPTGHRVRPGAIAAALHAGTRVSADPSVVAAEAWGRSARPDASVIEQSLAYDDPRGVLTIVWVPDAVTDAA